MAKIKGDVLKMAALAKAIVSCVISLVLSMSPGLKFNEGVSTEYENYDNVILLIGDGMGVNTVKAAKAFYGIDYDLNMETMPVHAFSKTDSVYGETTDSAAGGTALAAGIHTYNGSIGTYHWDPLAWYTQPQNITELAMSMGKAAGVVTTDATTGATPSSFSAHVNNRGNSWEIVRQQLHSGIDLIWGGTNTYAYKEYVEECGYTYVSNADELAEVTYGTKSYAQFDSADLKNVTNNSNTPTIDVMTSKAIEVLSQDEDGFFLMVEGACIDKFSHSNEFPGMSKSLMEFDKAVGEALEFAKEDGNTLVVVTADHETGGIMYDEAKGEYYYTKGGHSSADVPLYVSAADAGFTDGEAVLNRQVGAQLAHVLGASPEDYPTLMDGCLVDFSFKEFGKALKYFFSIIGK